MPRGGSSSETKLKEHAPAGGVSYPLTINQILSFLNLVGECVSPPITGGYYPQNFDSEVKKQES